MQKEKKESNMHNKFILDACCGGRCFWFNKEHPHTLYIDIEERPKGTFPERPNWNCSPDMIADFRNLEFEDKRFKHIVWDPPHLVNLGKNSIMNRKYGSLNSKTWKEDLKKGFKELWRVLDDYGTLVFKWNEHSMKVKEILSLFPIAPLYGHPTAKHGKTKWFIFIKIPGEKDVWKK